VEKEREDKLMFHLRSQVNDLLAATQLLTPLVREKGGERDAEHLAALNQGLYRLIRTLSHLELCGEEQPIFQPRAVDLAGLCRDVGYEVAGVAQDLGVDFTWELDRESLLGVADPTLLEQAILNLVTNAVQVSGPGGRVVLRFAAEKGRCRFTVQDNGPGLKSEDPDADPLLLISDGLGLGLTAARRVAALHGGALVLENGEGYGVRAVLAIPVQKPEAGDRLNTPPMPRDRTGGFSQLLVELSPVLPVNRYYHEDLE